MDACNSIPLAPLADRALGRLASASASRAIAALDGATILGERAMRAGLKIPGRRSAGGGCHLFDAIGDVVALNLARPADREMLPALLETGELDFNDDASIAAYIARADGRALVARGRSMGLAIAAEHERQPAPASDALPRFATQLAGSCRSSAGVRAAPRVVDLSALWAGPLAAHLLALAGAEVVKVESRSRPDALRAAGDGLYALLNQGKAAVTADLADPGDRHALLSLIARSDIVIEAARPRALAQLGIDADAIVRATPGLVWISITGHGAAGEPAEWVGFGDDCAVAGGMSAALRSASGRAGFVGDAIADPLTGIFAALAAWDAWTSRRSVRLGLAMSQVVAGCLATARCENPDQLRSSLLAWARAAGQPFPRVTRRSIEARSPFLGDIQGYLEWLDPARDLNRCTGDGARRVG